MTRRILGKIYIALILLFLYAPIAVLIVLRFNSSRSRVVWGGFTLEWYSSMIGSTSIMSALGTTFGLAFLSALISSVIGLTGALGIYAMRRRGYQIMLFATNIPMINADIVTGSFLCLPRHLSAWLRPVFSLPSPERKRLPRGNPWETSPRTPARRKWLRKR